MQGIKDERCCATLTITLTVGCLTQLNTSMGKAGKPFFLTAPLNLYAFRAVPIFRYNLIYFQQNRNH